MECPYCQRDNPAGTDVCSGCGNALSNVHIGSIPVGSRLQNNRYIIKKVLAQGGMGIALLATDTHLSKNVLVKELLPNNTDPVKFQKDIADFQREVKMLALIDHPLVPNVTDYFQEGTRYFMAQEYVEGEGLEARLNRTRQPIVEREVLSYASDLLDILNYLSQQHPPLVHRDIKPAHIIIGISDKRPHLVDFGIAREDVSHSLGQRQTVPLGTPGYAPPEQYQQMAEPRSDLYALAATTHHLLTNVYPGFYAPFSYPLVRNINPQLSVEVERVLSRALKQDITERYQSAAEMKRDIDAILFNRFGAVNKTNPLTIENITTLPLAPRPPVVPGAGQTVSPPPWQPPAPPPWQPPASPPWQPPASPSPSFPVIGTATPPPKPRHLARNLFLSVLVLSIAAGSLIAYLVWPKNSPLKSLQTQSNGIGAFQAVDGESIGVSDGTVAFDTDRTDGKLKAQAADKLKRKDITGAESLWQEAVKTDTNDAEMLIYIENQRVLASQRQHITLVVGTILTGIFVGSGRDSLQGAYVAQKEYNDQCNLLPDCIEVRLLIANAGSGLLGNAGSNNTSRIGASYASLVMEQILQARQGDPTIVGVMGWPGSSSSLYASTILASARIPIVSPSASFNSSTNATPYAFSVAPSIKDQGRAGAQYAERFLSARRVAVFVDPVDPYSESLADEFSQQFIADGKSIVATENYTVGQPNTVLNRIPDALNSKPDLIYFAGHPQDASIVLSNLPPCKVPACLQVLGGDALYELGGYSDDAKDKLYRLYFTAFAYPDEWSILAHSNAAPSFFSEYPQAFDPAGQHMPGDYGYRRTDSNVMLAYDAMKVLLSAADIAFVGTRQGLTPGDLQVALTEISGLKATQGVSGLISFGPDGEPQSKVVLVLHFDQNKFIHFAQAYGCFLKPEASAASNANCG
ncbi:MAG TPA: bifunctional serine/threonine-protein kinase/ABC transporter substrate-binding protein [Ktedonobacteraceae bacterium]